MSDIIYGSAEEKWIGFEDIEPKEIQVDPSRPLFINPKEAAKLLGIGEMPYTNFTDPDETAFRR